jgi:uncharacterized protein (UPF0303 family)
MAATKSFGTLFKIGTAAAGTAIGEILSVTPPELTVDTVENTTHNQADIYRKWIATLADYGELEVQAHMLAASITALNAKIGLDEQDYSIVFGAFGTDITMDFKGTLTSLKVDEAPIDNKLTVTFKIKLTGNVTWGGLS